MGRAHPKLRSLILQRFWMEFLRMRREFITLLGGAAAAWPLAARAQPGERMRRVGVLVGTYGQTDREGQDRIAVFLDTFRKLGWSDGRNVRIDYRWGGGDANR